MPIHATGRGESSSTGAVAWTNWVDSDCTPMRGGVVRHGERGSEAGDPRGTQPGAGQPARTTPPAVTAGYVVVAGNKRAWRGRATTRDVPERGDGSRGGRIPLQDAAPKLARAAPRSLRLRTVQRVGWTGKLRIPDWRRPAVGSCNGWGTALRRGPAGEHVTDVGKAADPTAPACRPTTEDRRWRPRRDGAHNGSPVAVTAQAVGDGVAGTGLQSSHVRDEPQEPWCRMPDDTPPHAHAPANRSPWHAA
eukprot:gene10312-biopygen18281